jgi:DNA-binding response OmpR family regulator
MARVGKGNPAQKELQGKRILIVEDHPSVSNILADVLGRYGYPSHANSGRDALEQIEHKAPDLILLDLRLPDINGLEVARLVRRDEKIRHTPILAMSASLMDYKKCLEAGCNDFICKPFRISTLLVRLSALIRESLETKKKEGQQLSQPLFLTRE